MALDAELSTTVMLNREAAGDRMHLHTQARVDRLCVVFH
jgi:hypothetical protein